MPLTANVLEAFEWEGECRDSLSKGVDGVVRDESESLPLPAAVPSFAPEVGVAAAAAAAAAAADALASAIAAVLVLVVVAEPEPVALAADTGSEER